MEQKIHVIRVRKPRALPLLAGSCPAKNSNCSGVQRKPVTDYDHPQKITIWICDGCGERC